MKFIGKSSFYCEIWKFRIRDYLKVGGTHFEKWVKIRETLFRKFCEWKSSRLIIHDMDLRQAAIEIAREYQLDDFKVLKIFRY